MSRPTRGLTLVETIAAVVLLTLIASICVPMLRHVAALEQNDETIDPRCMIVLEHFVDRLLVDPAFLSRVESQHDREFLLDWPDDLATRLDLTTVRFGVQVRVLKSEDARILRRWLLFTAEGVSVARCHFRPTDRGKDPMR